MSSVHRQAAEEPEDLHALRKVTEGEFADYPGVSQDGAELEEVLKGHVSIPEVADLQRFEALFSDLANPEVIADAWS